MKKIIILLLIGILLFTYGCQSEETSQKTPLNQTWDEVESEALGQTVNLYMWGGSDAVNRYFKDFVKPRLKEKYNVTLHPVPVTDIKDIVNKLTSEKQAEKLAGEVDLMWINGENFKLMKDNDLLYGNLTQKLPNFKKYIKENPLDFNEPTEGLEVPFGKAQFVLVYDEEDVTASINTLEDLTTWIQENPGQFTYPAIPDFTGSAFIRHFFYHHSEEEALQQLNALKPYLWREGSTYPNNSGALDQLYAQGEVSFTMSYTPFHAINKINSGEFSKTSKTLILKDGTLANTHFLTIPFNSQKTAGSLVTINYLLSFEAQLEKMNPSVWGDLMVLKNEYLSTEEQEKLNTLIGQYSLDLSYFENNRLNEFSGDKIEEIESLWTDKVLQ